MAATATELQLSRRAIHGRRIELVYLVQGTDDEGDAIDAVLAAAPATYTFTVDGQAVSLPRGRPEIEPLHVEGGDGLWEARVVYERTTGGTGTSPEDGDSSFNFDTTGGTQHITQSLATITSYAPPGLSAPNLKGAIGYDGKDVQGCDITVPVYRFSETHWKKDSKVTALYKAAVAYLTGKVNDASFKGFDAGSVLFLGASGSRQGTGSEDLWEITYHFAVSPNKTGITVGDITVSAKKGWEYLWVLYEESVDATAKAAIRQPRAAYVEQVYESGDLSALNIG